MHAYLDPGGNLRGVHIDESSNMQAFDDALLEAWDLAQPFTNPPPGMIEDDGFIHIRRFAFIILVSSAGLDVGGYDIRADERFPGLQTGDPMMRMR
jgi:hypothetical protein